MRALKTANSYLFKLAKKNVNRNRGRSFFIGLSVSLSVVMAVWILAFFDGLNHQIEKAVVVGNVGYWQLQEANYADTTDPLSPRAWDASFEKALQDKAILAYSPELILDGYLSGPDGSAALQVVGVDFALHQKTLDVGSHMSSGTWPQGNERGIVIGFETAERFQYAVGDQLVMNFQDAKGELRSELLPVLGVYHHNGRTFERRFAYVSGDVVEEYLFGMADPRRMLHRVVVMAKDLPSSRSALEAAAQTTKTELRSWKQINPEMGVVLDFHEGLIRFFFLIIAITVTVTILTPVSMLWQERLGEIRMMSIIGVPRKKIWRLGMFEAGIMTLLAATAASLILIVIITINAKTGIHFRDLSQGQVLERAGIQLPKVIYPLLLPKQLFVTYGFVVFIIFLSYGLAIRNVIRKAEVSA